MINRHASLLLFVFCLILFTTSFCEAGIFTVSLTPLRNDRVENDKDHDALLMGRVRLVDQTNTLQKCKVWIYLKKRGDASTQYFFLTGKWISQNGFEIFEAPLFLKAQSGKYDLYKVELDNSGTLIEGSSNLSIDIDKTFEIASNSFVDLGCYTITFTKKTETKYTYLLDSAQNENTLAESQQAFQSKFPKLFEVWKNNMVNAGFNPLEPRKYTTLKLVDDFTDNSNNWHIVQNNPSYDLNFKDGKYVFNNLTDNYAYSYINPNIKSATFGIDLSSLWQSGTKNAFYGLFFGKSQDDYYLVGITSNGSATVWHSYLSKGNPQVDVVMNAVPAPISQGNNQNIQRIEITDYFDVVYFVNGQYVKRFNIFSGPADAQIKQWIVGVFVSGKQSVAFDKINIAEFNVGDLPNY